MEQRTLEITVSSAKDLNKVILLGKMDVYVVVHISGDDKSKKKKIKTPVDVDGDANPTWNFPIKFTIDEAAGHQNRLTLVFKVVCERALGDKDIGEVDVPIKELLQSVEALDGKQQFVSYQVRKPNGKPKGQLTFGYKFGEKVSKIDHYEQQQPMMAYPVGPSSGPGPSAVYPPPPPHKAEGSSGTYPPPPEGGYHHEQQQQPYPPPPGAYPPPQPGYGYPQPPGYGGYPPQQQPPPGGYGGYPPPQHGYGYPPGPPPPHQQGYGYPPQGQHQQYQQQHQQQQPPKKNNKFGLGLGAGLLGGALGGMLLGDMVGDVGDAAFDF